MPIKYIPYYPNTVEGQAILDNITRTQRVLRYRENDKVYDRIKRGMPYYEVEPLETVGEPSENLVIRGECISACAYLKEQGVKVDLVYIDPPFASGADYAKKVYLRKNPKLAEKVDEAEQEMDIDELKAFEEKMYGDIWQKEDYLNWMYENLMAIKSIMSETASIYMHLDWHIGHYAKILMDEVFGEDNFVNEIIWSYRSGGASKKASIARKHDSIYFYTNDRNNFEINTINERQYLEKKFIGTLTDENGKFYVDTILTDTLLGVINRVMPDGTIKEYSCRPVLNVSKERVDYSTQKPEGLVELLIEIASKKGMVIADFFGGSGVTAKVTNDLDRKFIHCDIGLNSIQTVRDRLVEAKANFQILEIKDGVSLFRNPQQTMDKLAKLIPGLQKGVKGISNFWFGAITKSKEGIVPVYVPNLLNTQEKVLDIPTINTIINQELQNLEVNAKKIIVYYIDIDDQKALEKFIKDNNATEIEVELKDLKNLLHDVVIEDIIDFKTTETKDGYETEITKFISDRLIQKIGEFNQKGNLQSVAKGKKFNPINISEEGLELIELIALDCENTEGQWHSTTEIKIDKLGYVITNGVKSKNFWDGKITSDKKPLRIKVRNISGDETIKTIN
ncbi:site-specific DNA-methyltransferase [Flavobacterium branchiophilum]|uniref:site-specific DNA-methyltransferase (adenine-specific) n=2 Tax=Flavobacterium branchiophilum TaxID=55197 RepID=G2Z3B3_FLABF|nr:site-specific DNA-methyltransferase [Flavobacterium branchiophilum]PDS27135.1 site-specific DNA-methyltransferase [Flavobacterium branchiophilum]CCB68226.1 Probable type III modification methyltransferase [Flavobacterium branchiophilum FL-15]